MLFDSQLAPFDLGIVGRQSDSSLGIRMNRRSGQCDRHVLQFGAGDLQRVHEDIGPVGQVGHRTLAPRTGGVDSGLNGGRVVDPRWQELDLCRDVGKSDAAGAVACEGVVGNGIVVPFLSL